MVKREYVPIKSETLSRYADNARRLGNVETELTTEEMLSISANTADEVDNQTELIQQIKTALEGKAAGGSEDGGGFTDGNLIFWEQTITVGEDNGVTNYINLMNYFCQLTGSTTIVAYSLVGIADTYNQAICGTIGAIRTENYGETWRYRNGYINVGNIVWWSPGDYDIIVVPGTQYKVYSIKRGE